MAGDDASPQESPDLVSLNQESLDQDGIGLQPGELAPGDFVRLASEPAWGLGQVQAVAGLRVTVNFEDAGKKALNLVHAKLERVTA